MNHLRFPCINGSYDIVKYLIEVKSGVNAVHNYDHHIRNSSYCSPLTAATYAKDNSLKIAQLLLEKKADVNQVKTEPLYYAVSNQNIELIELFIKYGAKINETDCYDGLTPLHLACNNFSSPHFPFEKEVKNGTFVPMYKVTINKDKYKKAVEEKAAIIKVLLEYKADPHKKSDDKASAMSGKSAWEYVTKEGNIPEIQELFSEINLPNNLIGDIIEFSIIENNDFN